MQVLARIPSSVPKTAWTLPGNLEALLKIEDTAHKAPYATGGGLYYRCSEIQLSISLPDPEIHLLEYQIMNYARQFFIDNGPSLPSS